MIGACDSGIAADALARDVLATADCLIATQVEQGYAALLAPGGTFVTALTIGLTIYVAVIGYRLVLGLSGLTLGELVPHFIKIGVILALATSWASYQTIVFDLLFHGPQEVANVIVRQAAGTGAAGQSDVLMALQSVFDRMTDGAADAWATIVPPSVVPAAPVAAPVLGAPVAAAPIVARLPFALGAPQFVAALLWFSALVLMAASVGVLLVVRIVLALLLLLGPLFVALALFRSTRGLFEGWLRVTVKFALVPLFALPLIAVTVSLLAPISATLGDVPVAGVRDSPALLILLVVLVFAAVMVQAARLGGGIAAGIRLPRRTVIPTLETRMAADAVTFATSERARVANRAETIVQAIDASHRHGAGNSIGTTQAAILATRSISSPVDETRVVDNASRLGQGYRRLAIGTTAPRDRI